MNTFLQYSSFVDVFLLLQLDKDACILSKLWILPGLGWDVGSTASAPPEGCTSVNPTTTSEATLSAVETFSLLKYMGEIS